jgi:hypothetical protein
MGILLKVVYGVHHRLDLQSVRPDLGCREEAHDCSSLLFGRLQKLG